MRRRLILTLLLLLLACWAVAPAHAKEGPEGRNLLPDGSFERLVPGVPPKDGGKGSWTLPADKRVPTGWSLNAAYPGTLSLTSKTPAAGATALILAAPGKNDAQVFHPCPALQAGTWYRVSARVRAGTASLLVYEYPRSGAPVSHALGSRSAPAGSWQTLVGFYTPQGDTFQSASITLLVPAGGSVEIDDVQVHALDGPVADSGAKAHVLKSEAGRLTLSSAGQVVGFLVAGEERGPGPEAGPLLIAQHTGESLPIATLTKKGRTYVARFPDAALQVKFSVQAKGSAFLFEILDVKPKTLERVTLQVRCRGYGVRDTWMPGTYDAKAGLALLGVTPNTHTALRRHARLDVLEARWDATYGIPGGSCALLATKGGGLLPAIEALEQHVGLPSPRLPSSYGGETASLDWARSSPALKQSYLFVTYLGMGDIDKLIQYARVGGFSMILLHRQSWRASAGHEAIARTAFPEGLPTLKAVCDRIHAAGLGVGLHLYGPAVSLNDAYVTPEPDKRLFAYEVGRLAAAAAAADTELVLEAMPALPRRGAPDLYPGNLLRLGDEIIRWREVEPGTPVRITGCERGALGTKAGTHRKRSAVSTLVLNNGGLLVDPESTLPNEMGGHLARVVNTCKVDLVYFDAVGGNVPGRRPENWYYLNKVLLANCARFDHGVIVQTGQGPGRQLLWHLVPRSASADGHGDLKRYLDQRMPGIVQMRKTHTAADIGWYALDIHGRPDELEYVCAKALALDASVSVQAHKPLLESHPRAREVFEMISAWEYRRLAGDVPAAQRALLAEKGRDVRLLEMDADPGWSLWDARYDPVRAVTALDEKANTWTVTNDTKEEIGLALEIERVVVAATPAQHVEASAITIDDLQSAAGYHLRDEEALAPLILFGGRADTAEGFSRRGTQLTLRPVDDAAVGGKALELTLTSDIGGAGWGAAGRTLPEPLDLSASKSLGLWVHGDGRGASCVLVLADAKGTSARFTMALDYSGWRFQSFARSGPAGLDWSQIAHVILEMAHVPPKATVKARVAALRAMPMLLTQAPLSALTVVVGRRELTLQVPMEAGQVVTVDALGRGVWWPGGMGEGSRHDIAGGPLRLPPGPTTISVRSAAPGGYAGDLRVRTCRTWPLKP